MKVSSYSFGSVDVDGRTYTGDIIILPDGRIVENWWRREGHRLCLDDIKQVLESNPEVVVVGTGASGMMKVTAEVEEALRKRGIELIVENTARACSTYNTISQVRRTALAIHLTC